MQRRHPRHLPVPNTPANTDPFWGTTGAHTLGLQTKELTSDTRPGPGARWQKQTGTQPRPMHTGQVPPVQRHPPRAQGAQFEARLLTQAQLGRRVTCEPSGLTRTHRGPLPQGTQTETHPAQSPTTPRPAAARDPREQRAPHSGRRWERPDARRPRSAPDRWGSTEGPPPSPWGASRRSCPHAAGAHGSRCRYRNVQHRLTNSNH